MPSVNIVRTIIRGRSVSIGSRKEKNMAFIVCSLTGYVSGFFWLDDVPWYLLALFNCDTKKIKTRHDAVKNAVMAL